MRQRRFYDLADQPVLPDVDGHNLAMVRRIQHGQQNSPAKRSGGRFPSTTPIAHTGHEHAAIVRCDRFGIGDRFKPTRISIAIVPAGSFNTARIPSPVNRPLQSTNGPHSGRSKVSLTCHTDLAGKRVPAAKAQGSTAAQGLWRRLHLNDLHWREDPGMAQWLPKSQSGTRNQSFLFNAASRKGFIETPAPRS